MRPEENSPSKINLLTVLDLKFWKFEFICFLEFETWSFLIR